METPREVIDAFGNAQLAAALGIPAGTVSAWKSRGAIPHIYWRKIEVEAKRRRIKGLSYELLEQLSPGRKPRSKSTSHFTHSTSLVDVNRP